MFRKAKNQSIRIKNFQLKPAEVILPKDGCGAAVTGHNPGLKPSKIYGTGLQGKIVNRLCELFILGD